MGFRPQRASNKAISSGASPHAVGCDPVLLLYVPCDPVAGGPKPATPYAGATSCRQCHEKFYLLWSTSMHGQAMQPYTPEFAKARLTAQKAAVTINKLKHRADIDKGVVVEAGAKGTRSYRIEHVLGGKNVFSFLTSLDKGLLQTLP